MKHKFLAQAVQTKQFANGGQVGLKERQAKLKSMLFGETEEAQADDSDLFDGLDGDEPQEEPEKIDRKERLLQILNENQMKSLKKSVD